MSSRGGDEADPKARPSRARAAHQERGIWGVVSTRETASAPGGGRAGDRARRFPRGSALRARVDRPDLRLGLGDGRARDEAGARAGRRRRFRAVSLCDPAPRPGALSRSDRADRAGAGSTRCRGRRMQADRIYYRARQQEKAIAVFREARSSIPRCSQSTRAWRTSTWRTAVPPKRMRHREGASSGRRYPPLERGLRRRSGGRRADRGGDAILGRLVEAARTSDQQAYSIALLATALGRKDEAIRWLERAYDERSALLFIMNVELKLDPLRETLVSRR